MAKQITGQATVVTSGTAVRLGTLTINDTLIIKAPSSNTGIIYVGNDGNNTVSSTTGFVLNAGEVVVFDLVGNLSDIYVNASANNQKVCWSLSKV